MNDLTLATVFLIITFVLAGVVIMKKETIPANIRRPLAIITLLLVASAFIMLMVRIYQG